MCLLDNLPCVCVDEREGEGWVIMGSLVMVGVGPLLPLACAIFSGGLPWAGELPGTLGESISIYHWFAIAYCWTRNSCSLQSFFTRKMLHTHVTFKCSGFKNHTLANNI